MCARLACKFCRCDLPAVITSTVCLSVVVRKYWPCVYIDVLESCDEWSLVSFFVALILTGTSNHEAGVWLTDASATENIYMLITFIHICLCDCWPQILCVCFVITTLYACRVSGWVMLTRGLYYSAMLWDLNIALSAPFVKIIFC